MIHFAQAEREDPDSDPDSAFRALAEAGVHVLIDETAAVSVALQLQQDVDEPQGSSSSTTTTNSESTDVHVARGFTVHGSPKTPQEAPWQTAFQLLPGGMRAYWESTLPFCNRSMRRRRGTGRAGSCTVSRTRDGDTSSTGNTTTGITGNTTTGSGIGRTDNTITGSGSGNTGSAGSNIADSDHDSGSTGNTLTGSNSGNIAPLDILATHVPPRGIGDRGQLGARSGCVALRDTLRDTHERHPSAMPKVCVFGHVHTDYGTFRDAELGGTLFANVASVNDFYGTAQRAPIVLCIPVRSLTSDELASTARTIECPVQVQAQTQA